MERHVLVTGGAGFIGSNFVRFLRKREPETKITVLDALTYAGSKDNLADIPNIKFVKCDIRNARDLQTRVLPGKTHVIHFAAESHVTRSEKEFLLFYKVNLEGTMTLAEEIEHRGDVELFIHISTDEVYGPWLKGKAREEDKTPGHDHVSSDYAKSKSLADDFVQKYFSRLPIIIIRPTNNFGLYQHPEKAIARAITRLLRGEKIQVWGEGKQIRDWLYVEDFCRALYILLGSGKPGEIYNIGAENNPEISNLDLAKKICKIFGDIFQGAYELIPDPRPQHDFRYAVDSSKMRSLGWEPTDFMKNLEETVQWYKRNENWWRKRIDEAEKIYRHEKK